MPDTWRCECGYTNMNAKTCLVCRRPRQAVAPAPVAPIAEPTVEPVDDRPVAEGPAKRPLKARSATKKTTARKRAK